MTQLTKEQRYTISVMHKQGFLQKEIAATINKDKSVVSRELDRNRNKHGAYSYSHAQMQADVRKERLRKPRAFMGEVKNRVNRYMRQRQWSPEQIVGYCKLKGYNMVSIERICQYIREDKVSGGELVQELPSSVEAPQAPDWKTHAHQRPHQHRGAAA